MTRPAWKAAQPAQPRNNALAQIHIAKAQLGMDDDTYRAMLWAQARVRSAKDLDHAARAKVLAHLVACGASLGRAAPAYPGKPRRSTPERAALIAKLEALLADAGRPWAYLDGMVKRVCKVDALEFCDAYLLGKLVAALTYDARRRAAAATATAVKEPS